MTVFRREGPLSKIASLERQSSLSHSHCADPPLRARRHPPPLGSSQRLDSVVESRAFSPHRCTESMAQGVKAGERSEAPEGPGLGALDHAPDHDLGERAHTKHP